MELDEYADIWILKYASYRSITYADLALEDERYKAFSPFRNKKIFACNTLAVPYYEETPFHPDYLLKDIAKILYPSLFPGYKRRYFMQIR